MGDETRCTCGHLWLAHDDDACRPDNEKCSCTGRTPSGSDLPDAETAWKAWQPKPERHWTVAKTAFLAGFAAASGPWAEQLDAANAETEFWKANDNKRSAKVRKMRAERDAAIARAEKMESFEDALALPQLLAETAAERDAALARNAESYEDGYNQGHADAHADGAAPDRLCALRAELDNLRDRVNALADEWEQQRAIIIRNASTANEPRPWTYLRAIVRGSDDEAGEDT